MARSPLQIGLVVLGVVQLAQGAWMVLDPGSFFDAVGPFGTRNDHYVRDMATPTLALGVTALLAAPRPSWRLPVLTFSALFLGLHGVNHLADIGEADPEAVGVTDFVTLALGAAALAWLAVLARRDEGAVR
ncbi:MAG TPA: DUF6790 family protein [Baekduia sp.]|nr:DUF6790 family protein [Baekduia sp.]